MSKKDILIAVNVNSNDMLKQINEAGHIFIDIKITELKEINYSSMILITVIYREVPTRKVLIEKTVE
ncbi:MAG: hypothetical protein Q8O88_04195 [bacterium]|nr:hypothetical protein [bacterium]